MSVPGCLVCLRPVRAPEPNQDPVVWDCAGCGYFSVPGALVEPVESVLRADGGLRPRLSRVLRLAADGGGEGHVEPLLSGQLVTEEVGALLRDRASIAPFPATIGSKLDVALSWIAQECVDFGVDYDFSNSFGDAFCARIGVSGNNASGFVDELIRMRWFVGTGGHRGKVVSGRVTAEGLARVEALQNGLPDSTLVFLALSNHYGLDGDRDAQGPKLRDAIAAALPAPLSAYRVENDHSAVDITDEIVANIRRARFVVADLTCARPNVYFEAGLAMGLGKPVVFTRRAGETAHFDVAAYKIIEWAPGQLGDFTAALTNHIVARALI